MNFVEAALKILQEVGKPVHVDELCQMAVEKELLAKPGKNPLRSMKSRLTLEFKKGKASRIKKIEDNVWEIKDGTNHSVDTKLISSQDDVPNDDKNDSNKKNDASKKTVQRSAKKKEDEGFEAKSPRHSENNKSENNKIDQNIDETTVDPETLTQSLHGRHEYRDSLTQDEDRKILPEIKADRMRGRKRRREKPRRSSSQNTQKQEEWQVSRPKRERPTLDQLDIQLDGAPFWVARVAEELVQIGDGSSVPLRQLVQSVIKKQGLKENESKIWRQVKGILLKDQYDRVSRGERPLVLNETRDLFKLAVPNLDEDLADAERLFRAAHCRLQTVHRQKWIKRIEGLAPKMLERCVQIYLDAEGFKNLDWIKRLEDVSYGLAISPRTEKPILIALRGGNENIGQKGIGELWAGLKAKNIDMGLLISPASLNEDAKQEHAQTNSRIHCLCSDAFVDKMMACGVGVSKTNIEVRTMDDHFIDAILG